MIIEVFLLKDEQKNPESVTVTLTPETIAEEDSLRDAKVLHKNQIMVYWGNTFAMTNVTGCKKAENRKEVPVSSDGLKINFTLPKPDIRMPPQEGPN